MKSHHVPKLVHEYRIVLLTLFSLCLCPTKAAPPQGYTLEYAEEFDGTDLDLTKWAYRADAKHRSIQRIENISIADGSLRLNLTPLNSPIQGKNNAGAGIVTTRRFHYGYYEVRARLGDGTDDDNDGKIDEGWHHAFWAMYADPDPNASPPGSITTTFPPERRTEIDCYENSDGNQSVVNYDEFAQHIIIWRPNGSEYGRRPSSPTDRVVPRDTIDSNFKAYEWHTYAFEWTAEGVQFFVDGNRTVFGAYPFDDPNFEHDQINVWLTAIAANWCDPDPELSFAEYDYFRYFKPSKNFAYGRPATASSTYSENYEWHEAVDGIVADDHRWLGRPSPDGNTLVVELAEATTIRQAHLYSGYQNQAGSAISSIQLEAFHNGSWQEIPGNIAPDNDEFLIVFDFESPVTAEQVRLIINDTGYARVREFALWAEPTTPYTCLSEVYLSHDPLGDIDTDGVPNLIQHATVGLGSPYLPPATEFLTIDHDGTPTQSPGIRHTRNLLAVDTELVAEWSKDLTTWQSATFLPSNTIEHNDGTATWFWHANTEPESQNGPCFFRIKVTKVAP